MRTYQNGQTVKFVYRNSVGETTQADGVVVGYSDKRYYVRIAEDMPVFGVYCNKIKGLSEEPKEDDSVQEESAFEKARTAFWHVSKQVRELKDILWWMFVLQAITFIAVLFVK